LIERKTACPTVRMIFGVVRFELNCFAESDPPAKRLPPATIIPLAAISRLWMIAIGRRLGPKRAKDNKNRLNLGVLGGKCGSSHELREARFSYCHEMRNRYVHRTREKYPSAPRIKYATKRLTFEYPTTPKATPVAWDAKRIVTWKRMTV